MDSALGERVHVSWARGPQSIVLLADRDTLTAAAVACSCLQLPPLQHTHNTVPSRLSGFITSFLVVWPFWGVALAPGALMAMPFLL